MLKWKEDRREARTVRGGSFYCYASHPILELDGVAVGYAKPYGKGIWLAIALNSPRPETVIGSAKGKDAAKRLLKAHFQAV